jgi:hypothetical protein
MSKKLRKPKRPEPIKLMSEERVNWYLRQLDNPAFRMGLVRDGIWEPIKEKLIRSLNFYKIPIPDGLK